MTRRREAARARTAETARRYRQVLDEADALIAAGYAEPDGDVTPALGAPPGPAELWHEAGGGTSRWDPKCYRDLLYEHGHLLRPGDEGYENASAGLACRRDPGREPA